MYVREEYVCAVDFDFSRENYLNWNLSEGFDLSDKIQCFWELMI